MPKLSISQASQQWNLGRSTLYRAIQSGKLSATGSKGSKELDSSELLRVYGEPVGHQMVHHGTPEGNAVQPHDKEKLIAEKERTIEMLQKELDRYRSREQILLTHQTQSWWKKIFG